MCCSLKLTSEKEKENKMNDIKQKIVEANKA